MRRIAWALTARKWVRPCQEIRVCPTSFRKDSFTRSVGWNVCPEDSRVRKREATDLKSSYSSLMRRPTLDRSPCERDASIRLSSCGDIGMVAFSPQLLPLDVRCKSKLRQANWGFVVSERVLSRVLERPR